MTVSLLSSALLSEEGFRHGFALRTGGVSEGAFSSLNLGRAIGDAPAAVEENHARLAQAVGYSSLYELSQVHGRVVRLVTERESPVDLRREEGDALAGKGTGLALGVRVADCVPVLLADRRTGAVAAAHAGWRGAALGVVGESLRTLAEAFGTDAADVIAVIGPHIRAPHFEVGPEVAAQLGASAPGAPIVTQRFPKPHVELAAVLRHQLVAAGVPRGAIDDLGGCTFAEPERFFSYRRDGGQSGRHLAVIVGR